MRLNRTLVLLRPRYSPLVLGVIAGLITVGCQDNDGVSRYTVPRVPATAAPRVSGGDVNPSRAQAEPLPTGPQRMLAAIVPQGDRTWFFKLLGPERAVGSVTAPFRTLVASVHFPAEGAGPEWELPQGWHQQPGSGMRHATITIDVEGTPLELTVTPLKSMPGDFKEYVLANVNRWREQLGLPPTTQAKLFGSGASAGELAEVPLRGGEKAMVVDLVGEPGASVASMLSGSPTHPPIGLALRPGTGENPTGRSPLTYKTPAGWSQGKRDGMRKAAFDVHDGNQRAEVTAITLPAASADLLANVNRWREQVHLDPVGNAELKQQVQSISIDGTQGQRVELVGPQNPQPQESILGVICIHGGEAWFFKMKGDAAVVARERANFDTFVRSVKFRGGDGADNGQ